MHSNNAISSYHSTPQKKSKARKSETQRIKSEEWLRNERKALSRSMELSPKQAWDSQKIRHAKNENNSENEGESISFNISSTPSASSLHEFTEVLLKLREEGVSHLSTQEVQKIWASIDSPSLSPILSKASQSSETSTVRKKLFSPKDPAFTPPEKKLTANTLNSWHRASLPLSTSNVQRFSNTPSGQKHKDFSTFAEEIKHSAAPKFKHDLIKYHPCKTPVSPPTNWNPEDYENSSKLPSETLDMEHVFGYKPKEQGVNFILAPKGDFAVFTVAAVAVVQDLTEGTLSTRQRFFRGHTDDITCLALDNTGELAATGQLGKICWISVWFVDDCEEFKTYGGDGTYVCGIGQVAFSTKSNVVMGLGMDEKNTMVFWDIASGHQLVKCVCTQGPEPFSVFGLEWCKTADPNKICVGSEVKVKYQGKWHTGHVLKDGSNGEGFGVKGSAHYFSNVPAERIQLLHEYGTEKFVTIGKGKHLRFWEVDLGLAYRACPGLPGTLSEDETKRHAEFNIVKGRNGQFKPLAIPRHIYSALYCKHEANTCFIGCDSGMVYLFEGGVARKAFEAHSSVHNVYSLSCSHDYLFTGSVGCIKKWSFEQINMEQKKTTRSMVCSATIDVKDLNRHYEHGPDTSFSRRRRLSDIDMYAEEQPQSPKSRSQSTGPSSRLRKKASPNKEPVSVPVNVMDIHVLELDTRHVIFFGTSSAEICSAEYSPSQDAYVSTVHSVGHYGDVYGLAAHPLVHGVFATVADDQSLIIWNGLKKEPLKQTLLCLAARSVAFSPDGLWVAVAGMDGKIAVLTYLELKMVFFTQEGPTKDLQEEIGTLQYSPDGKSLAVGSHNNFIYIFSANRKRYALQHRLAGHSSFITHLDWSSNSRFLQSNCGGYEILYWDALEGKNLKSPRQIVASDIEWAEWTCVLGFPVMGIWPKGSNGREIRSVHRSSDQKLLVVSSDQRGLIRLFNYPCVKARAPHQKFQGHSSYVMNIVFLKGDTHVVSVGGSDRSVILWKLKKPVLTFSETRRMLHEQVLNDFQSETCKKIPAETSETNPDMESKADSVFEDFANEQLHLENC